MNLHLVKTSENSSILFLFKITIIKFTIKFKNACHNVQLNYKNNSVIGLLIDLLAIWKTIVKVE